MLMFVLLGFLGGVFIFFGYLLYICVVGIMFYEWGSFVMFIGVSFFLVGFVCILLGGGELIIGNMMVVVIVWYDKKIFF